MFVDLRGFTTLAETLPVEQVVAVLGRFQGTMGDAVLDHGGTLVDFLGDGLMAVFGAPIESIDHADRAVAAARDIAGRASPASTRGFEARGSARGSAWGSG